MIKRGIIPGLILALALLLASCNGASPTTPGAAAPSLDDASALLQSGREAFAQG